MQNKVSDYKNRAKCKKCNDVLVSIYRHDFRRCKCGSIFIDGGNNTIVRRGGNPENFDFSVSDEEVAESLRTRKE